MAYLSKEFCPVHKKDTPHVNGECRLCQEEKEKKELAKWEAMSTEDKLRDLHLRIKELEEGLPRF